MGNIGHLMKYEALLRLLAMCSLVLAAILMATDHQSKLLFGVINKKATFKVGDIFKVSVYFNSIVAGYALASLMRCLLLKSQENQHKVTVSNHLIQWITFFLDQMAVYASFAINCAALEFAMIVIKGDTSLQWMKWCDKYTRFCWQIGWSMAFAYIATVALAVISGISSFNLFRWYSPNFLSRKPRRVGNEASSSHSS